MTPTIAEVTVENLGDIWNEGSGFPSADRVRRVIVTDALVNLRTVRVSLPTRIIRELGLEPSEDPTPTKSEKNRHVKYWPARLTILGRSCSMDVWEVPDDQRMTIGHTVLTHLDLVVDPSGQTLTVNPANGGQHTHDLF